VIKRLNGAVPSGWPFANMFCKGAIAVIDFPAGQKWRVQKMSGF
jgi:hypothetical protein